jgi:arylsulfatase A-like enzyme
MSEILKKKNRIWRRLMLAGLAVVVIAGAGWLLYVFTASPKEVRHIVLISIDTCRADHLSCYGYRRETTPNIDAVASEAVLFNHALTPVALTLPAHASMLTGTIPPYHGVHNNMGYRLGESNVTISESLRREGYRTGAIISSFVLDGQFGLDQGFDSYNDEFVEPIESFYHNERRGDEASGFACEWLEEHRDEPFFLFLHYYDPHHAYDPPEPFSTLFKDNLYAGEIAYTDYCIGRVIRKLKELNLYNSTMLIIIGDHGESFGEHLEYQHGYFIYQSTIHVPLIMKVPGGPKGKRVDETAGLVDIVPTICSVVGITPPSDLRGRDLSGFLKRKVSIEKDERYIFCEALLPTQYGCSPLLGVVRDRWKYIQSPREELYELSKDPYENENLAEKQPKRVRLMREHLKLIIQEQLRGNESDDEFVLDEESKKRLESLGYVGSSISEDFEFDSTKDDAKDWIELHGLVLVARTCIRFEQYTKAEAVCKQIMAEKPGYILNSFLLGKIALGRNNLGECIEHFLKFLAQVEDANDGHSVNKSPDFLELYVHESYNSLGLAFEEKEDFEQAIAWYNKLMRVKPNSAMTHYNIGNVLLKQDKLDEAMRYYIRALELDPDFAEAHYNLGNVLVEQERFERAVIHYKMAVKLKPDWHEARHNLQVAESRKKQDKEVDSPWLRKNR